MSKLFFIFFFFEIPSIDDHMLQLKIEEEQERLAILEEETFEDVFPQQFRREDAKKMANLKMCRFFGHKMTCREELEQGKCSYLHDQYIRLAYINIQS